MERSNANQNLAPGMLAAPLRLSQGHLNLLETCPRKFQHVFLEQLIAPTDLDQQERLLWGARFHWLLQQWQLQLPVEPLAQVDPLKPWFDAFVQAAPTILELAPDTMHSHHQSEHTRILGFNSCLLTVVYDLLITAPDQAKILDWKTYPRPRKPDWLQQNWQTRLYPYVLVETSDYEPEQVSMTYWFFQAKPGETTEPQSYTFPYDRSRHEQTRLDLSQQLDQLNCWLDDYQTGKTLPKISRGTTCEACPFQYRCWQVPGNEPGTEQAQAPLPTLDQIAEVPL